MTGRRTKAPTGTLCRHCLQQIKRSSAGELGCWVHADGDNVFCRTNVQGHTAKFAEPS